MSGNLEDQNSLVINKRDVSIEYIDKLRPLMKLKEFIKTPHLRKILKLKHKTIFVTSGNRGGKTSNVALDRVLGILGLHPNPERNRLSRKIRCLSSSLPEVADPDAQDNAQYIELKKLLPYENILKDITARSQAMTISGHQGKHYIDFKSTKQDVQDTGKVDIDCLWVDEEPTKDHWNEGRARLVQSDGLTFLTLTPINGISWTYDEVYMKASYIWRSDAICDALGLAQEERFDTGNKDVAVVQMATDDNPTLTLEAIERLLEAYDDPDEIAVRRYGVFKQISGRVHKGYDPHIHYISFDKYFPNGIPYEWNHVRGIDYHESRIPWSVLWLSASLDDEWFLHREFHPAIDGPKAYTTEEICLNIVRNSGDFYYLFNLIDPLAKKKQANTGFSVVEDMNRIFDQIRQNDGLGTPSYWEAWDTKDTKGRDEVRKRLKNAAMIGKPFSNVKRKNGMVTKKPTFWICDTCPETHKSFKRWSYGEWATSTTKQINEPQQKPQQKFSHDPITVECLAKDSRLVYFVPYKGGEARRYSQTGRPMN